MGILAAGMTIAPACQAQPQGKSDIEAGEMVAELIGAPVYSADGSEIGEVADILLDEEGRPRRVKIKTAATLGLGERTVEIQQDAFIVLRGAVVLELAASDVQALPETAEREEEK